MRSLPVLVFVVALLTGCTNIEEPEPELRAFEAVYQNEWENRRYVWTFSGPITVDVLTGPMRVYELKEAWQEREGPGGDWTPTGDTHIWHLDRDLRIVQLIDICGAGDACLDEVVMTQLPRGLYPPDGFLLDYIHLSPVAVSFRNEPVEATIARQGTYVVKGMPQLSGALLDGDYTLRQLVPSAVRPRTYGEQLPIEAAVEPGTKDEEFFVPLVRLETFEPVGQADEWRVSKPPGLPGQLYPGDAEFLLNMPASPGDAYAQARTDSVFAAMESEGCMLSFSYDSQDYSPNPGPAGLGTASASYHFTMKAIETRSFTLTWQDDFLLGQSWSMEIIDERVSDAGCFRAGLYPPAIPVAAVFGEDTNGNFSIGNSYWARGESYYYLDTEERRMQFNVDGYVEISSLTHEDAFRYGWL